MQNSLNPLDYAVLIAYVVGTIGIGLWVGRKVRTGKDLFLAGRSLPWWAVGISLVATDIGATDIIGGGGGAYAHGLAIANFEWIGCVPAMIVGAFLFIPFLWRSGVTTLPEYLERRFNGSVRTASAVAWILVMACNLGIMLLASAKLMSVMFGWDLPVCVIGMALFCGLYTTTGGLAADVYTDVLQCAIMIGGCLAVAAFAISGLGGVGPFLDKLHALRGPSHTALVLPVDTPSPFPWTGIFFGLALVLSPGYWIGNQAIVQRALGARTEYEAKASYVFGALLKGVIPLIYAVPGLIALVVKPGLADPDMAIPTLVTGALPAGLRGLFLAAFLAALMSTVDSYLNSGSTLVTNDIYRRLYHPDADDRDLLVIGRWTTAGLAFWSIAFALVLSRFGNSGIYAVFQTLMSFFQGPMLAILLAGILWRRATGPGALLGFIGGILTAAILYALQQAGDPPLFRIQSPYLYYAFWSFVVALALTVAGSFLSPPEPDAKTHGLVHGGGGP